MNLTNIRNEIDEIDVEIIRLIDKRMELSILSKNYKKNIVDYAREKEVLENINKNLSKNLTSQNFYINLYKSIFEESKKVQGLLNNTEC